MKHLIIILAALALASCTRSKHYTIDGTIYGGGNFEGETIYLLPFFNTAEGRSDSTVVKNSRFHFEGEVDDDEVCILRFRPMMELFLDKLVVIKEPGHIWVVLNRPSTAKGTPQNDSLQHWREYQTDINRQLHSLNDTLRKAQNVDSRRVNLTIDSLRQAFDKHNRQVVDRNNNAFGTYVMRYAIDKNNDSQKQNQNGQKQKVRF